MQRIEPGPDQESAWDYPRPPALVRSTRRVRVEFAGRIIADTREAFRVLETSHPPTWYLPPQNVDESVLVPSDHTTFCEWKGQAHYYSLEKGNEFSLDAAWFYPEPMPRFAPIGNYLAFYPSKVDACWLDDERVVAQEGDFYGGWISSDVVGPFKGAPGSQGW